eukprot:g39441.t1
MSLRELEGLELEMVRDQKVLSSVMNREQILQKAVSKPPLGLTDVEEATSGAADAVDHIDIHHISEAKRRLRGHFVEHLCCVRNKRQHFLVASHCPNISGHSPSQSAIRPLQLSSAAEMKNLPSQQPPVFALTTPAAAAKMEAADSTCLDGLAMANVGI